MAELPPQQERAAHLELLDLLSRTRSLVEEAGFQQDGQGPVPAAGRPLEESWPAFRDAFLPLLDALCAGLARAADDSLLVAALKSVTRSRGVVVGIVNRYGELYWICPRVWTWLPQYLPDEDCGPPHLPESVSQWVSAQLQSTGIDGSDQTFVPLIMKSGSKRLAVRIIPIRETPDYFVLHFRQYPGELSHESLLGLGLSPREMDVLALLSRGESNAGIARSLQLSPRTVQTHLEHVYRKLGVDSRTAAAVWAFQMAARGEWGHP